MSAEAIGENRCFSIKATSKNVIPAKAGIHKFLTLLDSRLRGSDKLGIIRGSLKCLFAILAIALLVSLPGLSLVYVSGSRKDTRISRGGSLMEMVKSRLSKRRGLEELVSEKNVYLSEHPRANVSTALEKVKSKIKLLRQEQWLSVKAQDRQLRLEQEDAVLKEKSLLYGCYVIKTDLVKEVADKQLIHDRYKDLTEGEKAFSDCKTAILEVGPVFV